MYTTTELESIQLGNILFASALAFLYYDHLLTLDAEIRLIWKRPLNTSRYLFLLNRYFAALGNIASAVSLFSTSTTVTSCRSWELFHRLFLCVTQALVTYLLALRVYALCGCNRIMLISFMSIITLGALASIVITFVNNFGPGTSTSLDHGCHLLSIPQNATKTALEWEAILAIDTVLFTLTLRKAYRNRGLPSLTRRAYSLFSVVVRDGFIYYSIITSVNVVNIIFLYIPGPFQGNLSSFIGCLSVTLMSRMMLDIHEVADGGIYTNFADEITSPDIPWDNRAYTH